MDEYRQNEKPFRETGKTLVGVFFTLLHHKELRKDVKRRLE
jgi:hypothetical protein